MLTHVDLFSGIGGFALGLKWTGQFKTVLFCEIDGYCQKVLHQHWPDVPIIGDIHDIGERTIHDYDLGSIDLVTAGFPCQPFSNAGKRAGASDERYLWPELARAIRALKPRYILLENVPGLLSINDGREFGIVLSDLAACGYDAEWQVLPASAFGAWHRRDRIWIVAYASRIGLSESGTRKSSSNEQWDNPPSQQNGRSELHEIIAGSQVAPNSSIKQCYGNELFASWRPISTNSGWWAAEPALGRVADGVPGRVDRIKALGNAVVPQVVEWIGGQIIAFEESRIGA